MQILSTSSSHSFSNLIIGEVRRTPSPDHLFASLRYVADAQRFRRSRSLQYVWGYWAVFERILYRTRNRMGEKGVTNTLIKALVGSEMVISNLEVQETNLLIILSNTDES